MKILEILMRGLTHLNIGASIAMFAWLVWSGVVIMGGAANERSAVGNGCGRTAFAAATPASANGAHVCVDRERIGGDR